MKMTSRNFVNNQRGAIMLLGVFMAIFLCGCLFYVVGLGQTLLYRTHIQDAADSAAMAAAIIHAKGMNAIVFLNIMMAALLAILVALRLISTIASAVAVVAGGLCLYPPSALLACPVATLMGDVVAEVEDIYSTAKEPVELGLQGLHALAVVVRTVTPALGTAKALAVVYSHHQSVANLGIAIPSAVTLPTTDDTFQHLCEKAGGLTGDIVRIPFDRVPAVGSLMGGFLDSAISSLTKSVPSWFCGSGDAAPPHTESKHTLYRPTLDSTERCNKSIKNNDDNASALCTQSEQDIQDSNPDKTTGDCVTRCLDEEPYMERVEKARATCNPASQSDLHSYQWQFRHVTRKMRREPNGTLSLEDETVYESTLHETKEPPCDEDEHGWNAQVRSAAWNGAVAPVCTYSSETRDLKDGIHIELESEEVTHVFACGHDETVTMQPTAEGGLHPEKSNSGDSKNGKNNQRNKKQQNSKNMSPQKMEDGVHNGGGDFQVRGFVWGNDVSHYGELMKSIAAAGADDTVITKARQAGRLQLAQGEYFFADNSGNTADDSDYADLMMWRMKWTARLRRFRIGGYDDEDKGKKSESQESSQTRSVEPGQSTKSDQQSNMASALGKLKDMCKNLAVCDLLDSQDIMDVLVVH